MSTVTYQKQIPVRCEVDIFVAGGGPADKRNPDQAVIRDFVTGRSEQHWPMATRNPPRYNLGAIIISAALVWASILGAVWLVMN